MKRVRSHDPLVCFLYILGRDHLSLGAVEEIMRDQVKLEPQNDDGEGYLFCNGHLADYAIEVAERLRDKGVVT